MSLFACCTFIENFLYVPCQELYVSAVKLLGGVLFLIDDSCSSLCDLSSGVRHIRLSYCCTFSVMAVIRFWPYVAIATSLILQSVRRLIGSRMCAVPLDRQAPTGRNHVAATELLLCLAGAGSANKSIIFFKLLLGVVCLLALGLPSVSEANINETFQIFSLLNCVALFLKTGFNDFLLLPRQ